MLGRMSTKFPFYRKTLTSIMFYLVYHVKMHSITVCCKNILYEADLIQFIDELINLV